MNEIRLDQVKDSIVLYFGTDRKAINAYTLASALVSLADAIKEANRIINPGYEVEVLVLDAKTGSFKTVVTTVYKSVKNLFSAQDIKTVALAVVAGVIIEKCTSDKPSVIINNYSNSVVIEYSDQKVIIPKEAYEAQQQVEQHSKFQEHLSATMEHLQDDDNISSFGFIEGSIDEEPKFTVTKNDFKKFIIEKEIDDKIESDDRRTVTEITKVQIIKAILEKSTRQWEFVWNGVRIHAPVINDKFYRDFYKHNITIAPGDELEVELTIYQKRSEVANTYINDKYVVTDVREHFPQGASQELYSE